MGYVENIVRTFGGVRAMAGAIGRAPSTVQSWKVRGSIPDDTKLMVLATARRLGLGLSEIDFFPQPSGMDASPETQGDAA